MSKLSQKVAPLAYLATSAILVSAFVNDKGQEIRRGVISDCEHKAAETRIQTTSVLDANFETEVPEPRDGDRPSFVELIQTEFPKILRNPDAQMELNICSADRANCAGAAESRMPRPLNEQPWYLKAFPWHLTANMRDSAIKILDCEKAMQKCVLNKVLPHRTRNR